MTTGSTPIPVRSFQDVIDRRYRVIVEAGTVQHELLKMAEPGSAMHSVYYDTMHGKPEAYAEPPLGWHQVRSEEKTLYFESSVSLLGRTDLVSLEMAESVHGQVGLYSRIADSKLVRSWGSRVKG